MKFAQFDIREVPLFIRHNRQTILRAEAYLSVVRDLERQDLLVTDPVYIHLLDMLLTDEVALRYLIEFTGDDHQNLLEGIRAQEAYKRGQTD